MEYNNPIANLQEIKKCMERKNQQEKKNETQEHKEKGGNDVWKRNLFKEYITQKQEMRIFYNLWCIKSEIR